MPAGDRRHGEQELKVKRAWRWQGTWTRGHPAGGPTQQGADPPRTVTLTGSNIKETVSGENAFKTAFSSLPSPREAQAARARPHLPSELRAKASEPVANRAMCPWHTLLLSGGGKGGRQQSGDGPSPEHSSSHQQALQPLCIATHGHREVSPSPAAPPQSTSSSAEEAQQPPP